MAFPPLSIISTAIWEASIFAEAAAPFFPTAPVELMSPLKAPSPSQLYSSANRDKGTNAITRAINKGRNIFFFMYVPLFKESHTWV